MLDLFNIAKPQGCDIQTFYGKATGVSTSTNVGQYSWLKPRGVSFIYMMLIGAGSVGDTTNGGGSGAVTVWFGNANNVPDQLVVMPAFSGNSNHATTVSSKQATSTAGLTPALLLSAPSAISGLGGSAMTANQFAASGFFQSVAGQAGGTGTVSASSTTFLSGGTQGGNDINANYGYQVTGAGPKKDGYFLMQPIIVGLAASGSGNGGIGCGSGAAATPGTGGPGMVLIASW